MYHSMLLKEKGVKFVVFDPFYNDSYAAWDAEWIPCNVGCDTAIMIGLAYEMLKLDEVQGDIVDWDFLNKYSLGFDAEHMPEGEDPNGNYKDYLLGTFDGVPKNAEWAGKRSGVDPEKIKYVATLIGKNTKAGVLSAWSGGRNQQADNLPQAMMALGAMGGHVGKPGHMMGITVWNYSFSGGPLIFSAGSNGMEGIPNPNSEDCFCDAELWRGIYTGSYTWTGNSATKRNPGVKKDVDIKVIWHAGNARLQTVDDQNLGIKAHRKVDLVVSNSQYMTTNSKYADFILPVSTPWERPGGFLTGNREMMIMYTRVVDRY